MLGRGLMMHVKPEAWGYSYHTSTILQLPSSRRGHEVHTDENCSAQWLRAGPVALINLSCEPLIIMVHARYAKRFYFCDDSEHV